VITVIGDARAKFVVTYYCLMLNANVSCVESVIKVYVLSYNVAVAFLLKLRKCYYKDTCMFAKYF